MSRSLVYFALLTGCFVKPNRVDPGDGGNGSDGSGSGFHDAAVDAYVPEFTPRVIANAHYSDTSASANNGQGFYDIEVPAGKIHEGDLLVIIGNVDNGPQWHVPDASWQQQRNVFFGNDGQTFVVFTKVAGAAEPSHYGGAIDNVSSGAFTVSLLAIAKAGSFAIQHRTAPMCGSAGGCGENPVMNIADPVTTTVANTLVLFAAGADWLDQTATLTTMAPTDYTMLASFGDRDNQDFWWTTQFIAYKLYGAPQTTPTLTGSTTSSHINGQSWALTIAIEPQ